MAQITKKFIANNAVDGSKVRLDNNQTLRSRNAADNADLELLKVNTNDDLIFGSASHKIILGSSSLDANSQSITSLAAPSASGDATNKDYVDQGLTNAVSSANSYTDSGLADKLDLTGGTMTGALDMGNHAITSLAEPTATSDAATKNYVDGLSYIGAGSLTIDRTSGLQTALDSKLDLAGGTMSGPINMGSQAISSLADPVLLTDAATKGYVDGLTYIGADSLSISQTSGLQTALDSKLDLAGGTMTGALDMGSYAITSLAAPSASGDATSKGYVDDAISSAVGSIDLSSRATTSLDNLSNVAFNADLLPDHDWTVAPERNIGSDAKSFYQAHIRELRQIASAGQETFLVTVGGGVLDYSNANTSDATRVNWKTGLLSTMNNSLGYNTTSLDWKNRVLVNINQTNLLDWSGSNLDFLNKRLTNIATPTASGDAATKGYVDGLTYIGAGSLSISQTSGLQTALDSKLDLAGGTMTGALDMGNYAITSLAAPSASGDAVNKSYVDTAITTATPDLSSYLKKDGSVEVTGSLLASATTVDLGSDAKPFGAIYAKELIGKNTFSGRQSTFFVGDLIPENAATFKIGADGNQGLLSITSENAYINNFYDASYHKFISPGARSFYKYDGSTVMLDLSDTFISVNNHLISNVSDPVSNQDAATKAYVDAVAEGLDTKESVLCATMADVGGTYSATGGTNTSGAFSGVDLTVSATFDGVTSIPVGARILFKNQTDAKQNGIYEVLTNGATATLQRAYDQNGTPSNEVSGGNYTFVESGTKYENTGWVLQGQGTLTLNTAELNWVQFSGAGLINAGDALSKDGNDLNVNVDNATIKVTSDALETVKFVTTNITLSGTDITNKYFDLPSTIRAGGAITLTPAGGIPQLLGEDYTVTVAGGTGGVTRVSFSGGDLDPETGACALISGDKMIVSYEYL